MSNLCFLIYDFSQTGGAERAAAKLMGELTKKHNIFMISIFNKTEDYSYDLSDKVKVIKLVKGQAKISRYFLSLTSKIRKIIKKRNIDYLFAIDVATAIFGASGSIGTKAKFIMCDRSSCYNENLYSMRSIRLYGWVGAHFSYKYQVMTEQGKKGVLDRYGLKEDKVVVIPNWIEETAFKNESYDFNNKKIITVGRATEEKDYETLIQVAKRIKHQCEGWEWHIWGNFDNEYGSRIKQLIIGENLEDFVILKGVTKEIYNVYGDYSLYVMTSRFEGMPNVLLEARANKLPVIAFDCLTGPSELIRNEVNGYLIPMDDSLMMCDRIMQIVNSPEFARKLSDNSWNDIDRYNKKVVMQKWNEMLKEK